MQYFHCIKYSTMGAHYKEVPVMAFDLFVIVITVIVTITITIIIFFFVLLCQNSLPLIIISFFVPYSSIFSSIDRLGDLFHLLSVEFV